MERHDTWLGRLLYYRRLTQAKLARYSGVSPNYISLLTLGNQTNPSIETMQRLARGLNMSTAQLVEIYEEDHSPKLLNDKPEKHREPDEEGVIWV